MPYTTNPATRPSPTRAFDQLWLALGHRARRAILKLLARYGPLEPCALHEAFPHAARTSVNKHLQVLRSAGLVLVERHPLDRRKHCYRLAPSALAPMQAWLADVEDPAVSLALEQLTPQA
jgi:DNA-binding transcriptional ArsR family regulator